MPVVPGEQAVCVIGAGGNGHVRSAGLAYGAAFERVSMQENRRAGGFRTVGGLAQALTAGLARKGAGGGRLASIVRLRGDWQAIVGPELARCTEPEALIAGRGGKDGAKLLRLKVAGAAALEVQHMSGQIVERVNAYFGHRQIDDIRLMQGAIARPAAARPI